MSFPPEVYRTPEVQQLLTGLKVILHARVWKATTQMASQKMKTSGGGTGCYEDLVTGTFSSFGALSEDQERHVKMVQGWCTYHALDDALVESAISALIAAREDAAVKVDAPDACSVVMAVVRFCVTQPAFMQMLWNDMGERPRDRLLIQGLSDAINTLVPDSRVKRVDSVADDDQDLRAVDEEFPDAADSASTLEWMRNDFAQAQARDKSRKRQRKEPSPRRKAVEEPSQAPEPVQSRAQSVVSKAPSVARSVAPEPKAPSVARSVAPEPKVLSEAGPTIVEAEPVTAKEAKDAKPENGIQSVLAELQQYSAQGKHTFLTTVSCEQGGVVRDVQAWPMGWEIAEGGEMKDTNMCWLLFKRSK